MDLDRLKTVCAMLLDDADLSVGLDAATATITFAFTVGGSLEQVIFRCLRFWRFRYAKLGSDCEGVFVGETHVSVIEGRQLVEEALRPDWQQVSYASVPARLYWVRTEGGAMLDILCERFTWEVLPARP